MPCPVFHLDCTLPSLLIQRLHLWPTLLLVSANWPHKFRSNFSIPTLQTEVWVGSVKVVEKLQDVADELQDVADVAEELQDVAEKTGGGMSLQLDDDSRDVLVGLKMRIMQSLCALVSLLEEGKRHQIHYFLHSTY